MMTFTAGVAAIACVCFGVTLAQYGGLGGIGNIAAGGLGGLGAGGGLGSGLSGGSGWGQQVQPQAQLVQLQPVQLVQPVAVRQQSGWGSQQVQQPIAQAQIIPIQTAQVAPVQTVQAQPIPQAQVVQQTIPQAQVVQQPIQQAQAIPVQILAIPQQQQVNQGWGSGIGK